MTSRVIGAFSQFFDDAGDPLSYGWLRFLISETNNSPKNTYADASMSVANENPLQLDGAGRCPSVFGTGSYRVISYVNDPVTKQPGEQVQEFDNVTGETQGAQGTPEEMWSEWDDEITYQVGDICVVAGVYYRSFEPNNLNNPPTSSEDWWEEIDFIHVWNQYVTYATDELVQYGDTLYISLQDSNIGNQPDLEPTWWVGLGSGSVLVEWEENGTTFRPKSDDQDVGDVTHRLGDMYFLDASRIYMGSSQDSYLTHTGSAFYIINSVGNMNIGTGGVTRWIMGATSGNLVPNGPDNFALGSIDNEILNVYIGSAGKLYLGLDQGGEIYHDDSNLFINSEVGQVTFQVEGDNKWRISVDGPLYPTTLDSFDLGHETYVLRDVFIGDSGRLKLGNDQDASIYWNGSGLILDGAALTLGSWYISAAGNLYPAVRNTQSIGQPSLEIDNIYLGDGGRVYLGNDLDAYIMHDGTNGIIRSSGGKLTIENAETSYSIVMRTGSTPADRWYFSGSGALLPAAHSSYDIGATSLEVRAIYVGDNGGVYFGLSQDVRAYHDNSHFRIINSTGAFYLGTGGTERWLIQSSGHFIPGAANTYDIGGTSNEIRNIYITGSIYLSAAQSGRIRHNATNLIIDSVVGHIELATGGTTKWQVTEPEGHLLAQVANTYNIGGGSNEIKDIYVAGHAYFGLGQTGGIQIAGDDMLIDNSDTGHIYFRTTGSLTNRWLITTSGKLWPGAADTYDIGGPAGFEIKSLYMGSSGKIFLGSGQDGEIYHDGTNMYITPQTGVLWLGSAGASRWYIGNTGYFLPVSADTYDIGDTTHEVRSIYVGEVGKIYLGLDQDMEVYHSGGAGYLSNNTGHVYIDNDAEGQAIVFRTHPNAGSLRTAWVFQQDGDFYPGDSDSWDIGLSHKLVRSIYMGQTGRIYFGTNQESRIYRDANHLYIRNDLGVLYINNTVGAIHVQYNSSSIWQWQTIGHFIPSSANSYDIGGTSNEVRNIYIGTTAYFGLTQDARIIYDGTNLEILTTVGGRINIESFEHLSLQAGGASDILFRTTNSGTIRWRVENVGHLVPESNNAYDLGTTALSIRNIYAYNIFLGASSEGSLSHDGTDLQIGNSDAAGVISLGVGNPVPTEIARVVYDATYPGIFPANNDNEYLGWFGIAWKEIWATTGAFGDLTANGVVTMGGVYANSVTGRDMYVASDGDVGYLSSAARFKTSIVDMGDTSWIHDLKPREFRRINTREEEVGFIAEEVEKVNSRYVFYGDDGAVDGVDYRQINVALLAEVQQLRQEVNELKGE